MSRKNSEAVNRALDAVRRGNAITPDWVIEAAQDPSSPLHDEFPWDDAAAALEHRRDIARKLIAAYEPVVVDDGVITIPEAPRPFFVHDPTAGKSQRYITTDSIKGDDELTLKVLNYELSQVEAYLDRAERIAMALGHGPAVKSIRKRVKALRRRVEATV